MYSAPYLILISVFICYVEFKTPFIEICSCSPPSSSLKKTVYTEYCRYLTIHNTTIWTNEEELSKCDSQNTSEATVDEHKTTYFHNLSVNLTSEFTSDSYV